MPWHYIPMTNSLIVNLKVNCFIFLLYCFSCTSFLLKKTIFSFLFLVFIFTLSFPFITTLSLMLLCCLFRSFFSQKPIFFNTSFLLNSLELFSLLSLFASILPFNFFYFLACLPYFCITLPSSLTNSIIHLSMENNSF